MNPKLPRCYRELSGGRGGDSPVPGIPDAARTAAEGIAGGYCGPAADGRAPARCAAATTIHSNSRGTRDTRQLLAGLTPAGQDYARPIVAVIADLNREVAGRSDGADLAAALSVLQATMFDDSKRQRGAALLRLGAAGPRSDRA